MPNFSFEKTRQWLFLSFLLLLAIGTRKIFNFSQIENFPGFRENFSFSFFLFEVPLLFGFLGEIFLWWKKSGPVQKTFSRKFTFIEKFLLAFLFFVFLSFLRHPSPVTLYASGRLFEAIFLFFWVGKVFLSTKKILLLSARTLFLSGVFQSLLAAFQFLSQKSIGLYFLGESHLGPQILGVAKLEIAGQKFIRAYGTFPHPNLLGAFLLLSLASGLWLFVKTTDLQKKCRPIYSIGLACILMGILFSFSRSVWLATFLFLIFFFFSKAHPSVFSEAQNSPLLKKKLFLSILFFLFFLGLLFPLFPFLKARICLDCQGDQSVSLRKEYLLVSQKIIAQNPAGGIGAGNFTLRLVQMEPSLASRPWEIQPVHNLFFLATAELGFLATLFFLGFWLFALSSFWKTQNLFSLLFLLFLFLGFFDHYFWTLPQGQLPFFLALAFSAYSSKIEKH